MAEPLIKDVVKRIRDDSTSVELFLNALVGVQQRHLLEFLSHNFSPTSLVSLVPLHLQLYRKAGGKLDVFEAQKSFAAARCFEFRKKLIY